MYLNVDDWNMVFDKILGFDIKLGFQIMYFIAYKVDILPLTNWFSKINVGLWVRINLTYI